ncbi:MAG TPA: TlpA disulfide reductase family protein [Candidatus Polarisedimenticolia bacterium]|nr:TlpA disulfide reductase family protein [Candidatus Polarisedimenticolia bacterium]
MKSMRSNLFRGLGLIAAAALFLSSQACSSGSSSTSGGRAARPAAGEKGESQEVVSLDFSLPRAMGDGDVDLKRYEGTIRVVDFWATWCPPCRMAIPWLNDLHRKYKDQGVTVVGISVDENPKALAGFDKETHIEYVSLLSTERAEKAFGTIVGLPTTFVLDRRGAVYKSYVGEMQRDELESDIQALLAVR